MTARRANKIDANQPEIVDAFRTQGIAVESLAACGNGVPDLLVAVNDVTWMVEVKDGAKFPSQRKLNKDQEAWHLAWPGRVVVVYNADEAKQIANAIKRQARALAKVEAN